MVTTKDQVVNALRADEPDYPAIAGVLGPESAAALAELAESADLEFAAKSASLAGFMDAGAARLVLSGAVAHPDSAVRVAAASSLHAIGAQANDLLGVLLVDIDPGVRKWALKALELNPSAGLDDQLELVATSDVEPSLRSLARRIQRM